MTRRGGGPRALAPTIASLTRPVFSRRGFGVQAIIERWSEVAGPLLAARTMPERIAFPPGKREDGTLHLQVDGGSVALEVQHLESLLIERVNSYFGYRAISRLRMVQRPLSVRAPRDTVPKTETPVAGPSDIPAPQRVAGITDSDLRAALERLGEAVTRRRMPGRPGSDS